MGSEMCIRDSLTIEHVHTDCLEMDKWILRTVKSLQAAKLWTSVTLCRSRVAHIDSISLLQCVYMFVLVIINYVTKFDIFARMIDGVSAPILHDEIWLYPLVKIL